MSFWKYFYHPQAAMVLLRVTLAILMLFHGWAKVRYGIGHIEAMVAQTGLPGYLAYAVFLGEVVAPLFLLVGLYVVPAALVIAINMIVALILAHSQQFLLLSKSGGWMLELQAFFLVCALVVAMGHSKSK